MSGDKFTPAAPRADGRDRLMWLSRSGLWGHIPPLAEIVSAHGAGGSTLYTALDQLMTRFPGDYYPEPVASSEGPRESSEEAATKVLGMIRVSCRKNHTLGDVMAWLRAAYAIDFTPPWPHMGEHGEEA